MFCESFSSFTSLQSILFIVQRPDLPDPPLRRSPPPLLGGGLVRVAGGALGLEYPRLVPC